MTDKPKNDDPFAWQKELFDRFPLTLGRVWSGTLDVPRGWRRVLIDLCETIEPIIAALPDDDEQGRPHAVQVKEKFGGLRFYMSTYGTQATCDTIEEAIRKAERAADTACELCGEPGKPVHRGRGRSSVVACPVHRERFEKLFAEHEQEYQEWLAKQPK